MDDKLLAISIWNFMILVVNVITLREARKMLQYFNEGVPELLGALQMAREQLDLAARDHNLVVAMVRGLARDRIKEMDDE